MASSLYCSQRDLKRGLLHNALLILGLHCKSVGRRFGRDGAALLNVLFSWIRTPHVITDFYKQKAAAASRAVTSFTGLHPELQGFWNLSDLPPSTFGPQLVHPDKNVLLQSCGAINSHCVYLIYLVSFFNYNSKQQQTQRRHRKIAVVFCQKTCSQWYLNSYHEYCVDISGDAAGEPFCVPTSAADSWSRQHF